MTLFSYYDVLEIPNDATKEQIKIAHRTLSKKYHPDVYDGPDAGEKFQRIEEAYEVLYDDENRQKYDVRLQEESLKKQDQVSGLLVLRTRKSDVLPKHADSCSCPNCISYWINNPDQYQITMPYSSPAWYRKPKVGNVFTDLDLNGLLGKTRSLPENIEAAVKLQQQVQKDRWYSS